MAYCGDEIVDTRPIIGTLAPESPGQCAIGRDDEVTTELERVLGGAAQTGQTTRSEDLDIPMKRPPTPDPSHRTPAQAEVAIARTGSIDEDRVRQVVDVLVVREVSRIAEGHQRDLGGFAQFVESIAHGDGVGGARESMDVTVKDQDHGTATVVLEGPASTVGVEKLHRRCRRADTRSIRRVIHRPSRLSSPIVPASGQVLTG